ncbi:MAG: ABC transporter permease [Caldilineaceae bacterium]|nr:ABC transporter permease [Caldilineaceae bacterium]MBP8107801.1 ABC transporter permease [Caldilineaceae bacterium]MBP8121626.1 ABC transporter permease [Caldilineaceae bacterium]MBP9073118.1 ABC transporter permease [Caldilineaceae bacterium]
MLQFLLRRLAGLLLVIVGVSIITFSLAQLVPIDPAAVSLGQNAREDQIAAYRAELGLDRPVVEQYLRYVNRLLHGDLGNSIRTRRPVADDLRDFLPATIELSLTALLISLFMGIPLGMLASLRRNSWLDGGARVFALIGGSLPIFYLGLLVLGLFYRQLRWFPGPGRLDATLPPPEMITGMYTLDSLLTGNWATLGNSVSHLILPAITLGYFSTAVLLRMTRSAMLEVLAQEYIRTAKAKGLAGYVVLWRHVLKNALPPVLTTVGITFGSLLSGAVLTETIFNWPGLGRYATTSVTSLDFPAVMGVTLVAAIVYPTVNTLVDLAYHMVDPRVRVE